MATETVAVIGAGAAGLVTARELDRAGFDVTVFEQSGQPGGVWVYSPDTEDDQPGAPPVFSSLYDSLRTNLPRDLMPYTDYTFDSAGGGGDGWPRYPHHTAVLAYLRNFAADFGIARRVEQTSGEVFKVNPGSLLTALKRLERAGSLRSEWRQTENSRRAKYYELTAAGHRQLEAESSEWKRRAAAVQRLLQTEA